jgi:hypothetical protein
MLPPESNNANFAQSSESKTFELLASLNKALLSARTLMLRGTAAKIEEALALIDKDIANRNN